MRKILANAHPPQATRYLEKVLNAPRGGVLNPVIRNKKWIILLIILMFIPCSNGLGQGNNSDGYGSYDKMGQDPDEGNKSGC